MKKQVQTLNWKGRLSELMPESQSIGNDVILVEDYVQPFAVGQPFRTDDTTVILYEKGCIDVSINMKEYHIEAPAISFFLNGSILQYGAPSELLQVKVVVMSNAFLESLFQSQSESSELFMNVFNTPVLELAEGEADIILYYYRMLQGIVAYRDNPYRLETARHLTLSIFYGYAYRFHRQQSREKPWSRSESLCTQFLDLLRLYHKQRRDLEFYADKMCVSVKHLSKTVRQTTGKSASKWIEDHVITESKALLYSTDMSVAQIAEEMGFDDPSLFGKYFKRVVGVSPRKYRK